MLEGSRGNVPAISHGEFQAKNGGRCAAFVPLRKIQEIFGRRVVPSTL
jgi:hypothetical protein